MSRILQCSFLSLMLLHLAACSTMQPVNIGSAMQSSKPRGVDYGSLVEVKTLEGKTVKFRVTDYSREGIGGSKGFYRYEDMKSLRVENPSGSNSDTTVGYILGALGIIALVALVANADSVAVCSPSPCTEP